MSTYTSLQFNERTARLALTLIAALWVSVGLTLPALGDAPQIGQPAPAFTATDSKGSSLSLSQYRGKTVVLEWTNAECPFRAHLAA
jgi:hypothetical protein